MATSLPITSGSTVRLEQLPATLSLFSPENPMGKVAGQSVPLQHPLLLLQVCHHDCQLAPAQGLVPVAVSLPCPAQKCESTSVRSRRAVWEQEAASVPRVHGEENPEHHDEELHCAPGE